MISYFEGETPICDKQKEIEDIDEAIFNQRCVNNAVMLMQGKNLKIPFDQLKAMAQGIAPHLRNMLMQKNITNKPIYLFRLDEDYGVMTLNPNWKKP